MKETTAKQRETLDKLMEIRVTPYLESRQGKGVVSQFRRYVETRDPNKIGEGLYHFSTMGAGGLNEIAHYDIHGFRRSFPHPHLYLENLLWPETTRRTTEPHSLYVYTDGMTSLDVAGQIIEIAEQAADDLRADYEAQVRERDLHNAAVMAERHGFKLVRTDEGTTTRFRVVTNTEEGQ